MNNLDVMSVLDRLGVSYKRSDLRGGELVILCPFHPDKRKGSFSINIHTGYFNCYSCHTGGKGITTFVSKYLNISYKEAKKWLGLTLTSPQMYAYELRKKKYKEVEKEITKSTRQLFYPKDLDEIKVEDYLFFKERNVRQIFVDEFKWLQCKSGFYAGYIIIPVYFEGKLFSFEARKFKQYEELCRYFRQKPCGSIEHLKELQERFDQKDINPKETDNTMERYLANPKVLYAKGSRLKETIYNWDKISTCFDEPLHLVESISSLPNIWMNVIVHCSATFGSKVTERQIELLNKFKEIILYIDNDEAGWLMAEHLLSSLDTKLYIKEMKIDAARASKEELHAKPVKAGKWLYSKLQELHNDDEM